MFDSTKTLQAYLVDDELLAVRRLNRLLSERPDVEIVGSSTSPKEALVFLQSRSVDLLFLDIMMPGLNGFELLDQLTRQPMVIFTTAYDKHALRAFEVNSVDYLLKPIAPEQLDRAMRKVNALRGSSWSVDFRNQLNAIAQQLNRPATPEYSDRIASRIGDRTILIDLAKVTHFISEGKLTFALTEEKRYIVDYTLSEVERRTNTFGFQRIHRATLVNLLFIDELHRWFGGRLVVRLKDKKRTELTVSRDLIPVLKKRLGLV